MATPQSKTKKGGKKGGKTPKSTLVNVPQGPWAFATLIRKQAGGLALPAIPKLGLSGESYWICSLQRTVEGTEKTTQLKTGNLLTLVDGTTAIFLIMTLQNPGYQFTVLGFKGNVNDCKSKTITYQQIKSIGSVGQDSAIWKAFTTWCSLTKQPQYLAYAQFDKPFTGSKPRICALTEVIKQLCAVKPLALTESEIALAFGLPDPSSPPSPSPTPSPTPSPSPADNKPVRKRKAPEKFDEDLPKLHKRPKASSSRSHHLNSPSDAEMVFFNDVPYRSLGDLHRDARALLLQKDEEIRFLNGIIAEMKLQKAVVDTSLENKLELITYMKQQIETLQKQLATR